jgi:glycosyltransferase involved in cell wall biosynthesis
VKLACVVHRYGSDIAGGSEAHCRQVAEHLAAHHDVTVLTTCAQDHVTWRNVYPAGESRVGAVRIVRFPVARERSLHGFRDASDRAFAAKARRPEQDAWFRENGPDAPALLDHLRAHGREFDGILFWAFRYAPVYFGLPMVADRAILVPTAEDDPVVRMDASVDLFSRPAGFIFLTPEEQQLVARRLTGPLPPSCVVGSGLDPAPTSSVPLEAFGITLPFMLYLGRIDPNKGCDTLVRYFMRYASDHRDELTLVMAGPANMPLPAHPAVKYLGFVDDRVRQTLLTHATVLVVPSRFESLSLVLLEGWNHACPAIVNERCDVLKGQALRANGALYYRDYDEFARATDYLLAHPDIARELGRQGLAYVEAHYRWPHVMAQIEELLGRVAVSAEAVGKP